MSVLMTKAIQTNVIDYMEQCGLKDNVIAKFMAFIKNEDVWQNKSYQQLFDYIDNLYVCINGDGYRHLTTGNVYASYFKGKTKLGVIDDNKEAWTYEKEIFKR